MSRTLQADEIPGAEALTQLRRLAESADQYGVQSDAELLELYVRRKDQQAVEALIRRYAPMVASVCRLTVHDPASAEDAFQATFVVLLKSASKVCRGNSLAAWLHGVAYRTACRVRAMRKKQQSNHNPSALEMHAAVDGDPLSELARQMELEALDRELEKLPERLRQPLIEHYLLGYTAPEIADRMELSTSAVEGRLRRGRRALRTQLARRGISLSVVLAGASWFQQHVQASQADAWTEQLLDFNGCDLKQHNSTHPEFSSLVRGELNMLGTGTIKSMGAVAATLLAGTLVALAVSAHESPEQGPNNRGAAPAWNMAAAMQTQESPVVAQFGSPSSTGNPQPAVIASPASMPPPSNPSPASAGPATAGEGRMEGMDMDMGMGLAGGTNASSDPFAVATDGPQVIQWQRPASDSQTDGTPAWLAGGVASAQAIEKNRQVLSTHIDYQFNSLPLSSVVESLSDETRTAFELNTTALDALAIDPDTPINLVGQSSVRECIRRLGAALDLTYVVNESTIEITTTEDAQQRLNMRFYDLSYVLPNSANSQALVNAIQQTIGPDTWSASGGTNSISLVGSMMIVSAPDTTHQSIEILLLNISKMNPMNASKPTSQNNSSPGMFGLGGGMGGMGGGMGGMGGGMGGMGGGMGGMGGGGMN